MPSTGGRFPALVLTRGPAVDVASLLQLEASVRRIRRQAGSAATPGHRALAAVDLSINVSRLQGRPARFALAASVAGSVPADLLSRRMRPT
ncbi:hypothetical protein NY08_2526 [Rhodococcus sp. B7740]|nr:hypothetical protein NY08_2526 [Rhodococcus sp. B7740]